MVPPPIKEVDYNFSRKEGIKLNGQANQPILIDEKIFKNKIRNGFFIEAGAYDGELLSNTLFFEMKQRWTGLLIEPNPDAFELLKQKVRQYTVGPCISGICLSGSSQYRDFFIGRIFLGVE